MTRSGLALLAICALAGCSVVLDPSRHQDGAGDVDGGTRDAGGGDDGGGGPADGGSSDGGGGDAGGDDDGGGPDDGGTDAGPPCPGALTCEPAAPLGWNGPIVLVTGAGDAAPPGCPAMAPVTAFTARSGLDAPDATCGCTCTPPSAGQMSCGSAQVTSHTQMGCITVGINRGSVANGGCMQLSSLPDTGYWSVSMPSFSTSASGCTPAPEVTVPAPSWNASHRGCGFGTPTSCGSEQVCVPPRADGERLCVWVEGDSACPAAFPARVETAEDVTDTRTCSECTCGSITGSCGGSVSLASGCGGGGSHVLYARLNVSSCAAAVAGTPPSAYASGSYTPTASCPPSTPAPTGSTSLTTPRTVCCVE